MPEETPHEPLEMVPNEVPEGGYSIDLKGRYRVETKVQGPAGGATSRERAAEGER